METPTMIQRIARGTGLIAFTITIAACSSNDSPGSTLVSDDNADIPGATAQTAIGEVFVFGSANRTLYTFANDTDGVSNCSDTCLVNWPAVTAAEENTSGNFSTITRDDGTLQWAFKNRPMYYYAGDAAEGDVTGENLGNVWYVARPDPIGNGETSLGTVLVGNGSISDGNGDPAVRRDVNGLTLYTFRNDSANTSTCNDQCALNWPPHFADKGALPSGEFSLITRADGTLQWAYGEQALYFFQGDAAAGDTTGNGINGVWDVAVP